MKSLSEARSTMRKKEKAHSHRPRLLVVRAEEIKKKKEEQEEDGEIESCVASEKRLEGPAMLRAWRRLCLKN